MIEQIPFGIDTGSFAENPEPRVPCILLLDVSASMGTVVDDAGEDLGYTVQQDGQTYQVVSGGRTRMDALNDGIAAYQEDVKSDSLAAKRVESAIVTFGSHVQTVCEFTTAANFQPPTLEPAGMTCMGAAVHQAIDMLEERKQIYKTNGIAYYRPWIFLITDGEPNDQWEPAAERAKQGDAANEFAFFAVGVDLDDGSFNILQRFTNRKPLRLRENRFREMFQWLSSSLRSVSSSTPGIEVDLVNPTAGPTGWGSV